MAGQWKVLLLGQHSVAQLVVFCIVAIAVAMCISLVIDEVAGRWRKRKWM